MTALSHAAEAMVRQRIAVHAVNISGIFDLLTDMRTIRDPREQDVIRFVSLLNDLINEAPK